MTVDNILAGINRGAIENAATADEQIDTLLRQPAFELERIVSRGNATLSGKWYDQDRDEWVVVIQGRATLTFDNAGTVDLNPGAYLHNPARCRHRVDWTDPQCETVWLALHYAATAK